MPWRKPKISGSYRDVGAFLAWLRQFLLGRKHNLHARFPPYIAPRSVPTPEVPRGPEYKYSNQYYFNRHYMDSTKPPVVAPVALGRPQTPCDYMNTSAPLPFRDLPTPGPPWWWDGHAYHMCVPDVPKTPRCPPQSPCPCPPQPTPSTFCEPPTKL